MNIDLFDYTLPPELIAQQPARERDESRLMILDRATGRVDIGPFADLVGFLKAGDALIVNNTKVFKARLLGNRATGAGVEVFLVRPLESGSQRWLALVRPSRRVNEGETVLFQADSPVERFSLMLKENRGSKWVVEFESLLSQERIIERYGHVPLPQYIKRADVPDDVSRYQTIFARPDTVGAVAAPTAGFHFTPAVIDRIRDKGVHVAELTLHVGPGTFKPVQVENIEEHTIDPEFATLPPETADIINQVRKEGGRIYAVGTTSVRTLEAAPVRNGDLVAFEGEVDLYIKPGHQFRFVDHLLTNFHLPKSSLLILAAAFAGREQILSAYQKAVENKFRFYSYGDAMLIL